MIRIVEFLIAVVIVVVIFVVVGVVVLPSGRHVSETVDTGRPLPVVYDLLSGFQRFKDWSPYKGAQFTVSGPENGVGAKVDYTSTDPVVGSGTWRIVNAEPNKSVTIQVTNNDYGTNKKVVFTLERVGNMRQAVRITQSYDVDYGMNLFGRYAGLYVTRSVGDPMKASLNVLGNMLASIPKFDYTTLPAPPKVVKTPSVNLLMAPTTAKRANYEVQSAMTTQQKWLQQVMEKNGLVAAGPLRVITEEFGADTYKFDLAIPVKKAGAADTPADAPAPQLDVKIDPAGGNPVKYVQMPAASAVTAVYKGHMAALPATRDAMKAWAVVHAVTLGDHPYEFYNNGIASAFSDSGDFTLYWPLKTGNGK